MNLRDKVQQLIDKATISKDVETLIDNSGLEVEGESVTEKTADLIELAEWEKVWYEVSGYFTNNFPRFSNVTCETLPRMNLENVTSLSYKFSAATNLKRVDFYLNTGNCKDFNAAFGINSLLEYVEGLDISKATYVNACFANDTALKEIRQPFDFAYFSENHSSNETRIHMFSNCTALEEVRAVEGSIRFNFILAHSPLLSDESIQSIIDGLATVETAQTLTLHTDVVTKLTDEQIATVVSKNWSVT